jgi:beta-lactamase superfamily II metal-dependent hydrolase
MQIEIFDVEHGACALITGDNNFRIMIDCGHNASTDWYPGDHLNSIGISQIEHLMITNYDEDHVSGIINLFKRADAAWLWRNKGVSAHGIKQLKSEYGYGDGIEKLIDVISNKFTGPGGDHYPRLEGVEIATFHNSPADFDNENDLSLVVFLNCYGWSIVFPGDLTTAGWHKLLEREDFRAALSNVQLFVASHHGRENGICDEVFDCIPHKPKFVIISDKAKGYQSQETTGYYRGKVEGSDFRGSTRHVLTTRRDGNITFSIGKDSWGKW